MTSDERYRYYKRWRYDVAHGRHRLIDAHRVRLHLATLTGCGWSLRAIAGAAGTSPSVVARLADGRQGKVTRPMADALLAVDPMTVPSVPSKQTTEPFVSKVGTVRRIQALMAIGWTHEAMGDHLGEDKHWTANKLHAQGRWVTRTVHDRVAVMYRELCARPGPSERTRARAAARGYLPPVAWDDIDHDTAPDTGDDELVDDGMDEIAILRRMAGDKTVRLSKAEKAEVAARLRRDGMSDARIEQVTGINVLRYVPRREEIAS
jgi:lambda repressor-like predicted transcriptional regulator